MPAQEQKQRPERSADEVVEDIDSQLAKAAETREASKKKLAEVDELLDEIDALLEEETFVAAYAQKGGE